MEDNKSYHLRSLVLAAAAGVVLSIWLALLMRHPMPFEPRRPAQSFGWSWDFDYETATQNSRLAASVDTVPAPTGDAEQLILPLDTKVAVAGIEIIYRGGASSGTFKVDVIIPALDPSFAYSYELKEKEARQEFRLIDDRFKVTAIGPRRLVLQHLSP